MKKMLLIVACLALAFTVRAQAQLVISPNPPPHAQTTLTEAQFDAPLATVTLPSGQTAASTASYSLYGSNLNIRFATVSGVTLTEQVTLTTPQLAAFLAALPALPSGETASTVTSVNANRAPVGGTIYLFVQFSS